MGFSRQVPDVVGNAVEAIGRKRYNRWNISLSEISRDKAAQGVQLTAPENKDLLRALLFKYGMDIEKHYEVEICEHRNAFGEKVHCHYFLGIERHGGEDGQRWQDIRDGLVSGRWKVAA